MSLERSSVHIVCSQYIKQMGLLITLSTCVVCAKSNALRTGGIINILKYEWSCGQSGLESLNQGQDSNITIYEIVKEEIER